MRELLLSGGYRGVIFNLVLTLQYNWEIRDSLTLYSF